jgi:hypothetical protein
MSKNRTIIVNQIQITISEKNNEDYISLTDMVKDNGGNDKIQQWIRNKDTVEFLGVWEELNNPNFNSVEFHRIMYEAGVQRFTMSLSQWIDKTGAIGVISKAGKYGGTYAHKDIAFEFGTYLSPIFKLLLIKEFQRLKEEESKQIGGAWDIRRFISKVNYRIQTDAIKENLIPIKHLSKDKEGLVYAEEAELLNFALFGITSKEWKSQNPSLVLQNRNMRDYADTHQLIVMANLESLNAEMIKRNVEAKNRLETLREVAVSQLKSLRASKDIEHILIQSPKSKAISEKKDDKSSS